MADIEVRLLGPVVAVMDGTAVDLSSRKQRALLALLALHPGQMLSADRLVDELWGESPPPTARHALQVHVSNLRKLLGSSTVVTERPGYVLKLPADACDATRFEAGALEGKRALQRGDAQAAASTLADALALWRGPALSDLAFEPFAPYHAGRLEELRITALEDRLIADVDLGRHADVIGEIESLVVQHPLRERLRALLMRALYRSGRQVDALNVYREFRDQLQDELGLDPGPELRALEAAVLRQDATLDAPTAAVTGTTQLPAVERTEPAKAQDSRRVATVLVASFVGFDGVARQLDPEDLHALLDRSLSRLSAIVNRFDGTIETVVGGELVAVFGAPVAHEDDPERAVRAASEIHDDVQRHPDDFAGLQVRCGVSTGEVLFAASGPPGRRQLTVIGDIVNEARRLHGQADGGVVVSEATRHVTADIAEYAHIDGASVLRRLTPERRGRPLGLGHFVGRDAELQTMLATWRRSVGARRPHLISVIGEAGVGKSRLLAEFHHAARDDGVVVTGRCVPYGAAQTYAALSEAVQRAAGIAVEDARDVARSKLGSFVRDVMADADDAADVERHLALLAALDDERDRAGGTVDERSLHSSTRRFLEALASARPVCIVLEDMHWADDALLDLVQGVARRVRGAPLVFVTFGRPELLERRTDWGSGIPTFTSIVLDPLDEAATSQLVTELGSAHGISDEVGAEIVARSGGNPLFAEELVATLAEGEGAAGVPASLTSLLLARIDALPVDQQSVMRCASVIGVTFWPSAVEALQRAASLETDTDIAETIADLESRDLLRMEPASVMPGHAAFTFKHVLIQEAAYASLPRAQRKILHRAAGEWLTETAGERVGGFAEQLADHAAAAGQLERALDYLMAAAERSRRAASHRREEHLLAKAVDVASSLDRPDVVGELRARRGLALSRLARWAEAREDYERALDELPDDTDDGVRRRAEVHAELSAACFWLLDTASLRGHAEIARDLATTVGAREVELAARTQLTNAHSADGDVDIVLKEGRDLVELAEKWGVSGPFGTYSLNLYLTGDWNNAIDVARRAVDAAREGGDVQGVLWNMSHVAMSLAAVGRYSEAIATFDEAQRFGEDREALASLPRCIAMRAGFHLDVFDYVGAEEIQVDARERGRVHFNPSAVSAGIDLLFNFTRRGDVGRALDQVDAVGEEVVTGSGWHGWLWALRFAAVRAEIAFAAGDHEEAIGLAREALELARSKRRAKYEVFARIVAGRSLAAVGRKAEGLDELATAVSVTQTLNSPALHVLTTGAYLGIEPDEEIARSGAAARDVILTALPQGSLRHAFENAEATRILATEGPK